MPMYTGREIQQVAGSTGWGGGGVKKRQSHHHYVYVIMYDGAPQSHNHMICCQHSVQMKMNPLGVCVCRPYVSIMGLDIGLLQLRPCKPCELVVAWQPLRAR